jgi:hypothetical protein
MTDLRKAAEAALEALEHFNQGNSPAVVQGEFDDEIESLRQALAMENFSEVNQEIEEALKQPEQEPVAWMTDDGFYELEPDDIDVVPLYTAPPKREWVEMTSIEIEQLIKACASEEFGFQLDVFVNYINKKFRKMNT